MFERVHQGRTQEMPERHGLEGHEYEGEGEDGRRPNGREEQQYGDESEDGTTGLLLGPCRRCYSRLIFRHHQAHGCSRTIALDAV